MTYFNPVHLGRMTKLVEDLEREGGPERHLYRQMCGYLVPRLNPEGDVLTRALLGEVRPGDETIGCLGCLALKHRLEARGESRLVDIPWTKTAREAADWLGLPMDGPAPMLFRIPDGDITHARAALAVRRVIAGDMEGCWAE